MDVTGYLPIEQSKNAENIKDGDYQKDGLWYCGVCHRPKQHRIELGSFKRIVWCICQCDADRLQERKEKDDYEERMRYVQRLKMASCMPRDCMEAGSTGAFTVWPAGNREVLYSGVYRKCAYGTERAGNNDILCRNPEGYTGQGK